MSSRRVWSGMLRDPGLAVWCLFVLLGPFYVFPSGLPQPGDILIFVLVPLVLLGWDRRMARQPAATLRALLWFTAWVFLVNYGWAFVLDKWNKPKEFLIQPLFYIFNASVFFSALALSRRGAERFLRITVATVYLSVFAQVIASFYYRSDLYRGILFFNNPNQLGYYALLAACLFAMTQRSLQIRRIVAGMGITSCAYLAAMSASRAAVAGIAVLLFVLVFSSPRTIIVASLVAVGMLTLGGPVSRSIDAAEERSFELSRHGTFSEERGYDRIWKFPEYLVTGAGEGENSRFVKAGERARELHSSFGTVLFGYGIVGMTIFLVFLTRLGRGAPPRALAMLVPVLVYVVAHQGLRFTMFWVVLAAFAVLKQFDSAVAAQPGSGARYAGKNAVGAAAAPAAAPWAATSAS